MLPDDAILAQVARQTTSAVIITDANGLIEWVNTAFSQITGYQLEEVRGCKPGQFLQGPGTDRVATTRISTALKQGQGCTEELLNYRKDGNPFWVSLQISPVVGPDGTVIRFVAVQTDISERRLAEAALRRSEASLRAVISTMPLTMLAVDSQGRLTLVEGISVAELGLRPGLDLGRSIFDLFAPLPELVDYMRRALAGENFATLASVGELIFETRYSPLRDKQGVVSGAVFVALDVTEQVQATAELVRARDDAEAATRAKSAFLATMSHEIRTPLNAVIGMASLLLDTDMSPEQRRYAETIHTSGDMLLSVINDILDFSKIESGHMELERQPFDLRACIGEVIDLLAARATEKRLRLAAAVDVGVPPRLVGDVTRIRQILVNLVGNAVKFTHQGEILVRVVSKPTPDQDTLIIQIEISDTGIGIPSDRVGRLFLPFSQMDASTTRRYGGTGLGLAICKRLCDLMGGTISVRSTFGDGSTFTVELPVKVTMPARLQANQAGVSTAGLVPLRILLAEDNRVNQQVALRMLERLGYQADLAANGLEALQVLRRQAYDVVLMDVQMPELDGVEATRMIRAELPANRQPRIIAMTASAMVGDREACLAAGMDDYLSKPVQREALSEALRRVKPLVDGPAMINLPMHETALLDATTVERLRLDLGLSFAEDLAALSQVYREQLNADVATMRQATQEGNQRIVTLLAHRLHGASVTLGLQQAGRLCRMIEAGGRSASEQLDLLDQLVYDAEQALTAFDALADS
ncbi:MAG: ATP-binding protein [Oscillochloridaceae bacterium umkhey_bin13]